jgi:protein-tyrosine phosphatase
LFSWRGRLEFPIVDCHTHLLPGLDDGPTSWKEAEELALQARQAGTRVLVLTPHYLPGSYQPAPETIKEKTDELARRLATRAPDLALFPGCEAYLTPELPDLVRRGEVLTLGDGGSHLLVELPLGDLPACADEVLFALALAGVTPVLAHPERCSGVRQRPKWLAAAVQRGVLVQVNGESLSGGYGREVTRATFSFVRRGLAHFLGSDGHSRQRPAVLREAVRQLVLAIGEAKAMRLARENPAAVLRI